MALLVAEAHADFNPRSPHGERPPPASQSIRTALFQSTLPARGATPAETPTNYIMRISIHAPRTGSDKKRNDLVARGLIFQSTLPARGATGEDWRWEKYINISIHAPRTGSDAIVWNSCVPMTISIHAPRTGSDAVSPSQSTAPPNFNPRSPHGERRRHGDLQARQNGISIHAPRTGSDSPPASQSIRTALFQSTLPARGATSRIPRIVLQSRYFNPRSPHGERPGAAEAAEQAGRISIHAPRTGSDTDARLVVGFDGYFNPRSPHGERLRRPAWRTCRSYFNPRSPHGERPGSGKSQAKSGFVFQSTLPARGATAVRFRIERNVVISIHAPRTGSDNRACGKAG